jgi:dTDP-4-dehydrorhamnose 3,5-epimerase
MRLSPQELAGIVVVEPKVFGDDRGFFLESYQQQRYEELGIAAHFVQQNLSRSRKDVLRGLHYQLQRPQGKLCYVVRGEVLDVVVDIRQGSKTFGSWTSVTLDDRSHRQIYIPPGFAHGFCVMSAEADFAYHCTDYYDPAGQETILWNDPQLAIEWPSPNPLLSEKDQQGTPFSAAAYFA